MAVKISGVLKDGAGKPVVNCAIELRAKRTSPTVVVDIVATCFTGSDGGYAIDTEPGFYDVFLLREGYPPVKAGEIYVAPTDEPNTLNAFLDAPKDGDLRPEVMKRFEEMVNTVIRLSEQVSSDTERAETAATDAINAATSAAGSKDEAEELKNQAQQNAEAAAESERQAGQHAEAAALIKEQVETLADNVQQNTNAVEENTQRVEQLASQVEDTAEEVRQDTEAAKQAASDAEQARDEIDVALSATLKTANHLSEIAAEGEDAQQESRDNLGLKSAATMDVQTDIYNRTEGCVALPGAFGYGAYPTQRKDFDKYATSATFASWVQTTPPGRYLVTQYGGSYSKDIIEGVVFTGEVEIKMLETATHENQNRRDKFVIFNGVNQDVYCCEVRAGSTNIRWTCLSQNLTAIDGARWLYNIAGPWYDVPFRDVAVGGLTQAAYRAANTDEYTIKRCDSVSGSTLIPCAVIVSNDGAPRYVLDTGRHFSGSYVSLGNSTQATSDFIFGLFVRVA
ncbi:prophage tail fiber N-terminal domain-containing protein [Escherichia coli]